MGKNKGKYNKYNNKENVVESPVEPPKEAKPWLKSKPILLLKLFLVLFVVLCCVHYTDVRKYFDPNTEGAPYATIKRWDSFYELTENDSIDILILGNSHANHSINPKNLSATTGTISFVMAQNGVDLSDAYYTLEEALTRTHPKLCIVETFAGMSESRTTKRESAVSRMKTFSSRRNFCLKMKSMPDLYELDDYLAAWSPTIRNHEFIFRDTNQINRNILLRDNPNLRQKVAFDTIPLYLGRMSRFQTGLTDSLLNIYKENGPRIKCADTGSFFIRPQTEYFCRKIADLCKKENIPLLFLTVPMYHKHFSDYILWHNELAKIIEPLNVKWYDMQLDYDTATYTTECFENTYDFNQHSTYKGSLVTTYKLANYIHDSMDITLPNRSDDPHWNQIFYDQEGYFFNHSPNEQDTIRHIIAKDQKVGDLFVKSLFWEEESQSKKITLMIQKNDLTKNSDSVTIFLNGKMNGSVVLNANIPAAKVYKIDPVFHNLYLVNIIKEFDPDSLVAVKVSSK